MSGSNEARQTPQPAPPGSGGWIRRLLPFLMAHKRDVFLSFGIAIVGQTVVGLTPLVERLIIDDVIIRHDAPLAPWLGVLMAAGVFGFAAGFVRRFYGGRVSLEVQYDLRNAIYERLQRLDFARHDELQTGQLVSRANSDVGLLQALLSFLPIMTGNIVLLVVALASMLWLSAPLTLVMVVVIPALVWLALQLRTSLFPANYDVQQRQGELAGVVDEAVTGVRVVKGFGQEDRELDRLAETSLGLFRSRWRSIKLTARFTPTLQVVPALGQVGVIVLGGYLAIHGRLTTGTFLAFFSYLVQMTAPTRMFAVLIAVGQQARAGAERILDVLDSNPLVTEAEDATVLPAAHGEVVFDDVTFGYLRSQPVLDHFDLTVAPGETVALVGASGSGKSTVALLLPRFYDVSAGAVRVDGHDIKDLTFDSLRRQVGVVFEESFLFSDSIRANIAYGRPDATLAEVEAAARAAEAHEFILVLPNGYDTVVGERGLTLSGGQRQRIALARALITDPKVLILDDATSSVDARTEEEIHATLARIMEGRTTILVAHRRSTLRLADRIVVVDQGRVAAAGTHEELIVASPLYRDLLAGPGDSIEVLGADGGLQAPPAAPETTTAWPYERLAAAAGPIAKAAYAKPMGIGPGGGGVGGMTLSATPELMERVAALGPATGDPKIDLEREKGHDTSFALGRFVRPFRAALGIGLALVALDSLLTQASPFFVRKAIDSAVHGRSTSRLVDVALLFLAVALLDWGVTIAYTLQTGRTGERLLHALRIRIFAHLQRLGLDFYDREMAGRVMTRMTTDVEALSQLLQTGLITAITSLITCAGVLVWLGFLTWKLSLFTLGIVLPPLVIATYLFQRESSRAYNDAREKVAIVNANLQESLSGVRVAQAYQREDRNISTFRGIAGEHRDARMRAQKLISIYFPFVLLLADLASAIALGRGSALFRHGDITAGALLAFILYLDLFFSPIQQLSQVFDTYQQAAASMSRINELMAIPSSTPIAAAPEPLGVVTGAIRFEDVHFSYPGVHGEGEALAGIDLVVAPGETVALVGETGAGKSTLVKLAARYYDPTAGRVVVDGHDLRDVDPGEYRRRLGVVPQEAFLFTGNLRDNIAYGRPSATDAEVEEAARAVGAHDFIAGLPDGYLTAVTERGRSLSAGQRQLIALARARLVDPAILLLDEATSNLDLATEAKVQHAMGMVAQGRTTLLVAHRLPTARTADRIVVIDRGRVAEIGTHDELLAHAGLYARMWAAFETDTAAA